jgi:hypothetical protein
LSLDGKHDGLGFMVGALIVVRRISYPKSAVVVGYPSSKWLLYAAEVMEWTEVGRMGQQFAIPVSVLRRTYVLEI